MGERSLPPEAAAPEVKLNWRAIVNDAREREVIVTNYNRPEAVVMSAQRYAQLQAAARDDPHSNTSPALGSRIRHLPSPTAIEEIEATPEWTKPIVAAALQLARRS